MYLGDKSMRCCSRLCDVEMLFLFPCQASLPHVPSVINICTKRRRRRQQTLGGLFTLTLEPEGSVLDGDGSFALALTPISGLKSV